MLNAKKYTKILLLLLIFIFTSVFIYAYYYSKFYPLPLTHRISLDAKLMFIRDMPHKDMVDTIIVGSSMGLDNLHGDTLAASSTKVKKILNLSAFSIGVTGWERIWSIIELFPNAKRIIYSTQSLDFTEDRIFEEFDLDFVKNYTKLGKNGTNIIYSFYTYKHILSSIPRHWDWESKFMSNNKYTYLEFDHTGGISLHIYGDDIDKKKWDDTYAAETTQESYLSLTRLIQSTKKQNIKFYVVVQPYRKALLKRDNELRKIVHNYYRMLEGTTRKNGAKYLNLDQELNMGDEYFADRIHLNDKGNVVTSKAVGRFIDKYE